MKYIEKRTITREALRSLCIEKQWYTNGTNEDYEYLMRYDRFENLDTDDIMDMAANIKKHSITEHEITSIAFELNRVCITVYEEMK
jgi:hypothetical protein